MKKQIWTAVLALILTQGLAAKEYSIDKSHSQIGFSIRHMFSNVAGKFNNYSGNFNFDLQNPGASKGTFIVKAASIDTSDKKRDDHLKSAEFFDTKKFPELRFTVSKMEKAGFFSSNEYILHGILELHGAKKAVIFNLKYLGTAKDPWGSTRSSFTATATINRKDFGIVWNKTLDSGGLLIGEKVEITLNIEGLQKK